MSVSDKTKELDYGFEYGNANACANNGQRGIQQAEKNDVLYIPAPFKAKRSHVTPPCKGRRLVLFLFLRVLSRDLLDHWCGIHPLSCE